MSAPSCPEGAAPVGGGDPRPGQALRRLWQGLRQLTGDDAYDRYLEHHHRCHAQEAPLDRRTFWCGEVERRWSGGVRRCC